MSTAKEPPEDGTPASGSGTPAGPEATTRVDAVPAGENGGSERAAESATGASGSAASGSAAGSASSEGPAGGPPPPWQRAASSGAGAGGAATNAGPAGAPRSAPFPAQGAPRPSPTPHGPPGGARPESGPMPTARPGPESGPMPAGRPGGAAPAGAGAAAGAPRPGGGGGERPASSTALIDAPTNQLSPEQLGMRSDRDERSADGPGADDAGARAPRGGGKAPRRASLQVRRFDPWSVLKLALVLGVALFFVWMFAVGVLYAVLDGMGVWAQLNGTYQDLTSDAGGGGGDLITAAGVFGVAAVVGVVNTILFTALASVSAFIYNISADVAGGIEVTLSERD